MTREKRNVTFKMRMTPSEFETLKEQSKRTGLSMSDVIRSAWQRLKIAELPSEGLTNTALQLRRIGNELAGLSRSKACGEDLRRQFKKALDEITALDRRIGAILSGGDS